MSVEIVRSLLYVSLIQYRGIFPSLLYNIRPLLPIMAPPAADIDLAVRTADINITRKVLSKDESGSRLQKPLVSSGSLEQYEHLNVTPIIGEEFPKLQLSGILSDDNKIRDLAILGTINQSFRDDSMCADDIIVSQRGVVFFRNQDLNIDDQKVLGQKLGELTGKPDTSKVRLTPLKF